jgi:thioredoxin reductase (NADPH)
MSQECIRHHDLVIIGGGGAGLSAGLYAVRARIDTLLLEARIMGGQLLNADIIENYPGFPEGIMASDLVALMDRQARRFGLEVERAEVELLQPRDGDFLLQTSIGDICGKAVIISTGGHHKHLGVPGERELAGRGVSYCATCDGPLYRGKTLAVVGGGNTAVDEAIFLSHLAKKVYLIHRRDELRAEKILQERAFARENIEFLWSSVVSAVKGDKLVEAIQLKNLKTGEESSLSVQAVFVAIGMQAATAFLPESVKRDEFGFIITDREMRTSLPGVFAAGDVIAGSKRQLSTGVGEGTVAFHSAQQYLFDLPPAASG